MFTLELKVRGFSTTDSLGRKSYSKATLIKWQVEFGCLTLESLMQTLRNEVKWAPYQDATIWFWDKTMFADVRLVDEKQMSQLFEMYKTEMGCQVLVGVFDKSEELEPLCVLEPDADMIPDADIISVLNLTFDVGYHQNEHTSAQATHKADDNENPTAEEADASEPDRLPDMFDNDEEYVGVNDECMYIPIPAAKAPIPPHAPTYGCHDEIAKNVSAEGGNPLEAEVNDADPLELHVLHDPKNPNIQEGAKFPDIYSFRKAIRHFAVKRGFELASLKTDKTRFIAKCKAKGCPWRIHASRIFDNRTIEIKKLPNDHNCATTKLKEGKMASQGWCADRLGDWLKKNPHKGAKDAKEKLEGDYGIKLKYSKAWSGMKQAIEQIHGKYEETFQLLFNWKAQIEMSSPGSIVEIELEGKKKKRFKRIFVALKPCIDGFLAGCRPFLGVDATSLNGQYTGQLASATAIDGHNWLYNVAYAVFDSETEDNWKWFMQQLHRAVGSPPGLVICTDACKGLETAVGAVFPEVEYRECMRHLYANFMKHYTGDVFTEHLYPAARSYTEGLFQWHIRKIYEFAPDAIQYLETCHNKIWYRCAFSVLSKCDYLTNNVSESFNSQIKKLKGLLLHELVDGIREMIMEKMYLRRKIARTLPDGILSNVMKELNTISNNLRVVKVSRSDDDIAEVTLLDQWNNSRRHTVDLQGKSCSCREWQVTGKPCKHALAWICSNRGLEISDYVHEYYSVARFAVEHNGLRWT